MEYDVHAEIGLDDRINRRVGRRPGVTATAKYLEVAAEELYELLSKRVDEMERREERR